MNRHDVWGALAGLGAITGLAALARYNHQKHSEGGGLPSGGGLLTQGAAAGGILDAMKNYVPHGDVITAGVNPSVPSYNQISDDDDIAVRRAKAEAQREQWANGIAGLGSYISGSGEAPQMNAPAPVQRPQMQTPQMLQPPSLASGQFGYQNPNRGLMPNQPRYF